MAYFLRKEKRKNGVYLQMYENYWDADVKQGRTRHVQSFGFVDDLVTGEIPDPVAYYTEYVRQKEEERRRMIDDSTRPRAFDASVEKNAGYFLISALMKELKVEEVIGILASVKQFRFSLYEMMEDLIYARIIDPCSKSKTVSSVFPLLFNGGAVSEDQVYDGCFFIGETYEKYIELFNKQYENLFPRSFDKTFFDCTNYYFEIDLPGEDRQKGPSKENRHEPIIGQALLLDADLVPLGMKMYPGNESEKPYIRRAIEDMKRRYNVSGKTIQVADKGLNCARNIYAAVVESSDGYIFSKSVHGKALSKEEKAWVLLEDSGANRYTEYRDAAGKVLYRIKSCIDTFTYDFKETDPDTGKETVTRFSVKEKRVVSYNPSLAAKQKAEILKQVEKVSNCLSYKKIAREELGDAVKYVSISNVNRAGKKVKPVVVIDQDKVDEDLRFAGYNLLVTSETDMNSEEIYRTYHDLWKIEESFRITKSFLDARPVYVQKKETIYGHFLICYLCLFLLRVLEIKCFENKVNSTDIIRFVRDFRIVKKDDKTWINLVHDREAVEKMKTVTGLTLLDALYLSDIEVSDLFHKFTL